LREILDVQITGDKALLKKYRGTAAALKGPRMKELWERASELIRDAVADMTPQWRRTLYASIDEEPIQVQGDTMLATIFTDTVYAAAQERGTAPYWPNIDNIEAWAFDHGMTAYVAARAIANSGVPAAQYALQALQDNAEEVYELTDEAVATILELEY